MVVAKELQNIATVQVFFRCSVDSHKCAVWGEFRVAAAKLLAQ
jgi:hypothetical protein